MNKYTIIIGRPEGAPLNFVSVQIEARNLGSAVRNAVARTVGMDEQIYPGQYQILFCCDGWPRQYSTQECYEAAK